MKYIGTFFGCLFILLCMVIRAELHFHIQKTRQGKIVTRDQRIKWYIFVGVLWIVISAAAFSAV